MAMDDDAACTNGNSYVITENRFGGRSNSTFAACTNGNSYGFKRSRTTGLRVFLCIRIYGCCKVT